MFVFFVVLALDYDWWTSNSYPNPFRFIVQCTVLADRSVHDIDFQLDLIDVNDNAPRFSQSIYHINLVETTPINTIISNAISAIDPDSGLYGTFSYYLQNNVSSLAVSLEKKMDRVLLMSSILSAVLPIDQHEQRQSGLDTRSGIQFDPI